MKTTNFFSKWIWVMIPALAFLACNKDNSPDEKTNNRRDKAEYKLVAKEIGRTLIGKDIDDTTWDPEIGIIYLGPDENIEPLGSLTLTVGKVDGYYQVTGATFSTSDRKVGTGPEINGRLFVDDFNLNELCNFIHIKEIGQNFIEVDDMCLEMIEVVSDPAKTPQSITLTGNFVALE